MVLYAYMYSVHVRMKLVQERQFTRALFSARVIALNYLELHVRSKIRLSEIQSFLLRRHVKCLI